MNLFHQKIQGITCIAYDYNFSEDFLLDRDENEVSAYEKLNNMIGLKIVKEQIDNIIAADIVEKERKKRNGNDYQSSAMHMIFGGNPGSAKTTVAKLFAGITKEKGILKSGAFVERGGMDLDGLGCVSAIREAFLAARGGVLFIDEAYAMKSDTAITVMLQEMENQRENVIVILAGYNERMKAFMKRNEGLKSRIPYWIDFPDYTAEELTDIFKLMIHEKGFCVTDLFYIFYDKPLLGAGLGYISIIKELYSFIGFGMTLTYNGERGKQYKWLNYFFYPVHILILGLLRIYLNI